MAVRENIRSYEERLTTSQTTSFPCACSDESHNLNRLRRKQIHQSIEASARNKQFILTGHRVTFRSAAVGSWKATTSASIREKI